MIIEVRKDTEKSTYLVRIGDDLYEMGLDADEPYGYCQYTGVYMEGPPPKGWFPYPPLITEIPIAISRRIAGIVRDECISCMMKKSSE
jgi:hypothetical protein